jgi:hypothetical protein
MVFSKGAYMEARMKAYTFVYSWKLSTARHIAYSTSPDACFPSPSEQRSIPNSTQIPNTSNFNQLHNLDISKVNLHLPLRTTSREWLKPELTATPSAPIAAHMFLSSFALSSPGTGHALGASDQTRTPTPRSVILTIDVPHALQR